MAPKVMSGIVLLWTFAVLPVHAQEVHIAAASNFSSVINQLEKRFEEETGNEVSVSLASTGKLYTQIKNGAPYEIFLSADNEHPQLLINEGDAVADSLFIYAIGRLVLWSHQAELIDKQGEVLKNGKFNHLAIANPKTAPYGAAAQQVLEKLAVWDKLQDKIVQAENISQAYQFIATGNAELGFIALSQYKERGKNSEGSYWLVSEDLYSPIEQSAVLLKKGEHNEGAKAFMAFLRGEEARLMIEKVGYTVPK